MTEHKGGRRTETYIVSFFTNLQPLFGGGFSRCDLLADGFGEHFCPTAGNGSHAGIVDRPENRMDAAIFLLRHKDIFGRTKRVDVNFWRGRLDCLDIRQPLFQPDIGIVSALQQYGCGAHLGCLAHLLAHFTGGEGKCFGVLGMTTESTKPAAGHTNVSIVGIGIEHKGNALLGVAAHALGMGQLHQLPHGRPGQQFQSLLPIQSRGILSSRGIHTHHGFLS